MRILVVEDERKLAGFIRRSLREDGHAVDVSYDGEEGAHLALSEAYDALILDLMLPHQDGFAILKEVRKRGKRLPVLILTALDAVKDKVAGLDLGADDYMTKPFSLDELRARIRALLRRGDAGPSSLLRYGDVELNLLARTVHAGTQEIRLTSREFAVLEYFLRNPRIVLTRTAIAEHVWDYNFDWKSNVVDVFVNSVRRKLEEGGRTRLIHTVRGSGYILQEERGR